MTCYQQQTWKKTLDNNYLTAYQPSQILAVQDYITQRLASNHLTRPSKEKLFSVLMLNALKGQQLTGMVEDANIRIKDLKAKESEWLPFLPIHRRLFTPDELNIIAQGGQTAFHYVLRAIIRRRFLLKQGRVQNWNMHNQLRELITQLGEKPDFEFIKLGIQYKAQQQYTNNSNQPLRIKEHIQYLVP